MSFVTWSHLQISKVIGSRVLIDDIKTLQCNTFNGKSDKWLWYEIQKVKQNIVVKSKSILFTQPNFPKETVTTFCEPL